MIRFLDAFLRLSIIFAPCERIYDKIKYIFQILIKNSRFCAYFPEMIRVCPLCWRTVSNVSARRGLLLLLPWDPGRAILRLSGRAFERLMRQLLSHIRQNLCKLRIIRHLLRFSRNILAYISAVWFCRTYVASLRSSRLYPVALHCWRSPTERCNGVFRGGFATSTRG